VIAAPRLNIPRPAALSDWFPAPPATPLEAARQAGALLVAQAQTCQDADAREEARHRMAARIAAANKQLARQGHVYGWEHLPGWKQKEFKQ
jgi:hypothetical protein